MRTGIGAEQQTAGKGGEAPVLRQDLCWTTAARTLSAGHIANATASLIAVMTGWKLSRLRMERIDRWDAWHSPSGRV